MAAHTNGPLAAHSCLVGVHAASAEWPSVYSRAYAAPNGIRHEPFESPLAPHAGVTGAQHPGRGGGAGPARGCGARSPANLAHA
jgi:hypothetical protein